MKLLSNRKKYIHEWLHKFLALRMNYRQDMKQSSRNSKERPKKVGSFQISDERVNGRGEYAISPDQKDFELKLNLRINGKQRHQQQHKQEQQQKPNQNLRTQRPPQPHQPRPTTANCIHSPFEQEALRIHNRYRTMHGAPALILNCDMSKNATNYARTLADMDALVQSGDTERPNQGENLSLGCHGTREQTAEEAIKTWFDEVCQYTFGKQGPQSGTNHFTQLVWKESRELGIGRASNKQPNGETCTFIVARYKPLGNFENGDDAYVKNIQKGTFDETYCRNIPKAGLEGGYGFKRFQSPNFNGTYGG
ncbi:Golgi-associated plant pathogenesis-related protein 1 [Stylophora pistillata]|uniref:Golgi-associated plant pathogenesis-related protein 1 n=2 Tax=Stylophora pistillata TaxID=50429 RepID=A0A2B4S8U8_STYPI|nr:Golgi-associated plant pathogenesis-related protein 1 [Stylophora pistillata]